MSTRTRKPIGFNSRMPWWLPLAMLGAFYLFGWVLRYFGIIPGH